jgi:hypothetical protein
MILEASQKYKRQRGFVRPVVSTRHELEKPSLSRSVPVLDWVPSNLISLSMSGFQQAILGSKTVPRISPGHLKDTPQPCHL